MRTRSDDAPIKQKKWFLNRALRLFGVLVTLVTIGGFFMPFVSLYGDFSYQDMLGNNHEVIGQDSRIVSLDLIHFVKQEDTGEISVMGQPLNQYQLFGQTAGNYVDENGRLSSSAVSQGLGNSFLAPLTRGDSAGLLSSLMGENTWLGELIPGDLGAFFSSETLGEIISGMMPEELPVEDLPVMTSVNELIDRVNVATDVLNIVCLVLFILLISQLFLYTFRKLPPGLLVFSTALVFFSFLVAGILVAVASFILGARLSSWLPSFNADLLGGIGQTLSDSFGQIGKSLAEKFMENNDFLTASLHLRLDQGYFTVLAASLAAYILALCVARSERRRRLWEAQHSLVAADGAAAALSDEAFAPAQEPHDVEWDPEAEGDTHPPRRTQIKVVPLEIDEDLFRIEDPTQAEPPAEAEPAPEPEIDTEVFAIDEELFADEDETTASKILIRDHDET